MCRPNAVRRTLCLTVCLLAWGPFLAPTCAAQENRARTKIIEPVTPRMRPPQNSAAASRTRRRSRSRNWYRASKDSSFGKTPPKGMTYGTLGVTVMRQRLSTVKDGGDAAKERLNNKDFVWERVNDNSPLVPGDQVRISVESSEAGYLYVVNQEQYADGTLGRALLIFPTLLTYDGDNSIKPRIPRIIPAPDGTLEIRPNNRGKVQVAERLTIIVSPAPLDTPRPLTDREMELPPGWVEKWERDWAGRTDRATWLGKAGHTQTKREHAAGQAKEIRHKVHQSQALNDDDPPPQNYYQVTIRAGMPTLVVVPLQFKAK